ncbi:MAG: DUF4349 domain-containing protein [Rickettsiales bacterium]|jgi:hypothetical protein|nr:DUF4349 domain-containing protein [Rickettsiales bacterium]
MKKFLYVLISIALIGCSGASIVNKSPSSESASNVATYADKNQLLESNDAVAERMVTYSAKIRLGIVDNDSAEKQISEKVLELKGYVAEESEKSMIVYIPAPKLDGFIEYLGDNVGKIIDKSKSGRDVTDSYGDDAAELSALKSARDQYSKLLKKASSVDEILKIEKELERINAAILKLERRIMRTERSVEYSRVVIELEKRSWLERTLIVVLPPVIGIGLVVLLVVGI